MSYRDVKDRIDRIRRPEPPNTPGVASEPCKSCKYCYWDNYYYDFICMASECIKEIENDNEAKSDGE